MKIPTFKLKSHALKNNQMIIIQCIISIFLEDLGLILYNICDLNHLNIIGTILNLLFTFIVVNYIRTYKNININKIPTKNIIKITLYSILTIIISNYTWLILINLYKKHIEIISKNQNNIHSFLINPPSILNIMIFTIILAPILEEYVFRFLIIKEFKTKFNKIKITISLLLFTFIHIYQDIGTTNISSLIINFGQYFLIGCVLTFIYLKFKSYKLNIIVHMTWNLLSMLILILNQI